MDIDYAERLGRMRRYLDFKDYDIVVKEAGTVMEIALKELYEYLLGHLNEPARHRLRQCEQRIGGNYRDYTRMGLGSLIALFREGDVLRLLEAHSRQDFHEVAALDINSIVDVRARNAATHGGVIPPAERAEMSYYNLRHFLVACGLMDLEDEPASAPREEVLKNYYHIELGIWAKGHATPEDLERAAELAQQLKLTAAEVVQQRAAAQTTCALAIQAYQQQSPHFTPPEPPVYLSKARYNLPSVLTQQLQQGLQEYLEATFPVANPTFQHILKDCLKTPGRVFKGPYVSVKFPFCQGQQPLQAHFSVLSQPYLPYLHQEQAYLRLGTATPQPTLVATGTGSGKTECFLHPILQHCYDRRDQQGIKAILIYPMNALATDQSRRLARDIERNPALKGQITAGLYIGGQDRGKITMGPDHLMTDRETLRQSPPDILVTNYKMLDYLLTRPDDYPLWQHNGPLTLQYLVVDEIHTFDGAQGTDLACLIRRLKARLACPTGHLCPVGTSATLGDKSAARLLDYATQVFGETFGPESLITEQRQDPNTFFARTHIGDYAVIQRQQREHLDPQNYTGFADYIAAQYALWFGEPLPDSELTGTEDWRHQLGERLKTHRFFYNLMKQLQGAPKAESTLLAELSGLHQELKPESAHDDFGMLVLNSMVALISVARDLTHSTASPFLQVRSQLWLRELKRLQATVHAEPELRFEADPRAAESLEILLPLVHCRACHYMAWGAVSDRQRSCFSPELESFYRHFFNGHQDTVLLYPDAERIPHEHAQTLTVTLCTQCLAYAPEDDPTALRHERHCQDPALISVVRLHPFTAEHRHSKKSKDCPLCQGQNTLSVVGSQASSLSSVGIAQLFGSPFNADKKLIAFSDSVQDASHRAGFFTARSYTFNLRTAVTRFLQNPELEAGLSLQEMYGAFSDYWLKTLGEVGFITTFLPADMHWLHSYDALVKTGTLDDSGDLLDKTLRRLEWELYREFTFRSRVGRTLERSNLLTFAVPEARYEDLIKVLCLRLPEECPQLGQDLSAETLEQFIRGVLWHMKSRGAVYHSAIEMVFSTPLKFGIYASQRRGKAPLFLPRHLGYAGPVPLSDRNTDFDAIRLQRGLSYVAWWAQKVLCPVENFMALQEIEVAIIHILTALTHAGILRHWGGKQGSIWAIDPQALQAQTPLTTMRCHRCQHSVNVPEAQVQVWLSQPCLQQPCEAGQYHREPSDTQGFYQRYYQRAEVGRILSAEHTGLLSRQAREQVEQGFMAQEAQRMPWYPNLLSCTPTMEMGIDIGDLSSVLLCQVPPAQSNYLQRIGRSGRKDGNSLNLTVATAQPHDLYYFNDPLEMIAGEVEPPGVFLGAAAVLERQFIAYCFDCWVASGLEPRALPRRFQQLIPALKEPQETHFPFNFFAFVKSHEQRFVQDFCALFEAVLTPEEYTKMQVHIAAFAGGDAREGVPTLSFKMLEALSFLAQEVNNYERDLKRLSKHIRELEAHPAQDDQTREHLEDMLREQAGLRKIRDEIKGKSLFNVLTEEGLLPNYAFPEEGVTLRSIVYRKREQHTAQGKPYEVFEYAYQRPAAAALRELAPNNPFFAGGRKITVDQVELRFRGEGTSVSESSADIEHWRFCNACTYMRQEGTLQTTAALESGCPRCGSVLWRDQGQLRELIRMRQVFSNMSLQDSLSGDDSDERAALFYEQALLVNFEPEDIAAAYVCQHQDFPFGFEFIDKVQLREVNFGEGEGGQSDFEVNGQQLHGVGFVLCRFCGKVQPRDALQKESKQRHSPVCRRGQRKGSEVLLESAYLYRTFQSEALRIFLPETGMERLGSANVSFTAAILVGLKAFFSGNVDHLQAAPYHEPIEGASNRAKHYLVLYDTVPGGTGYLKQLAHPDAFYTLCRKALHILQGCACQYREVDPDGCYHCIYTYRHKRQLDQLSRNTAIELLTAVLRHQDDMQLARNISEIDSNSLLESELERLFIETLRKASQVDDGIQLLQDLVNGKPGYTLMLHGQRYQIEPQVSLGAEQHVEVPSRCDFLLRHLDKDLKIAVFTDGFQFHQQRVALDIAQRMALVKAGYVVWSLSWDDVKAELDAQTGQGIGNAFFWNPLASAEVAQSNLTVKYLRQGQPLHAALNPPQGDISREHAMKHLLRFLAHPEPEAWQRWAKYQMMAQVPETMLKISVADQREREAAWCESLQSYLPQSLWSHAQVQGANYLSQWPENEDCQGFSRLPRQALNQKDVFLSADAELVNVWVLKSPVDRKAWNGWLRLYNLFQFLPHTYFLPRWSDMSAELQDRFERLLAEPLPPAGVKPETPPQTADWVRDDEALNQWQAALDLCDEDMLPLLNALKTARWPVPEVGYEVQDAQGKILGGVLELAYPLSQLAFVLPEQTEDAAVYIDLGWRLVTYDGSDPAVLISSYARPEEQSE